MFRTKAMVAGLVVALAAAGLAACSKSKDDKANTTAPPSPAASWVPSAALAKQLAAARDATAPYATDLAAAQRDGYGIITQMMPGMGFHYMNPKISDFDVTKPPILVYLKRGSSWQLGAVEWVFPQQPASPPLEGATYGSFDAACHYLDGTFIPTPAESGCAKTSPGGSPFNFWHPTLVTMHVWLWYDNPAGLYHGTNPLVEPYNA